MAVPTTSVLKNKDIKITTEREKHPSVHFKLDDELPIKGNFKHLKKKTKKFEYEERLKGHDRFFHADVATECETYFQGQRIRFKEKKTEHFAFIVDLDAYEYHKVVFHSFLNEILQSSFFRFSILLLVLINATLIGLQTDAGMLEKWSTWFHIFDQIILSVFLFEILVKWIYDFRLFWKVMWNILDFLIVSLIILAAVIPSFGNSRALVVVRVVRAFRSLRSVSFLSSLSIVTHTIIKSGVDMGNILLVLMIFMLVMSVMGVILFDLEGVEKNHFLNALNAWFVIFICVTQDGWNQVLDEFRKPDKYFPYFAVYLIFAVSIGAFVFANLIVAVIVANLELSVKELREEKRLSDNPLEFNKSFSTNELEVQPIYDLLCKNNMYLFAQRPLRIPNLRKFSPRRIQAYISLIVALEQNMLEAEIIHLDMEKIMGVMLSIVLQLEMYSQLKAERDEQKKKKAETMDQIRRIDGTLSVVSSKGSIAKPISALPDINPQSDNNLAFLQTLKNRISVDSIDENDKLYDSILNVPNPARGSI